ncbi:hypothetical protein AVEN_51024-1 [Araneus ventricosus]|uniref:SOCS box domain-containing protein n=1 Tax=Araneus ventricosus TaxID=182803 RepID=A0A4Y2PIU5_ARAVE|nr:hypothetical protein AVEN_51024-1 [Araneus ventricosus]
MYEGCLNQIITETLQETNQKVKLIHQVSKMVKRMKFLSKKEYIWHSGLYLLCYYGADSTVVKDFLSALNFDDNYLFLQFADVFEFVLNHANRAGYKLWSSPSQQDQILTSIRYRMYAKTESLLQHRNAPRFCDKEYEIMKNYSRFVFPLNGLKNPVRHGLIRRERHFLILQFLHFFYEDRSKGQKVLQMLWRSIPDPFISLDELASVFSVAQNSRLEEDIRSFIEDVTGAEVPEERGFQPRKLKHFCRTAIRNVMNNNGQLSAGISQLILPPSVKSFLRLEN